MPAPQTTNLSYLLRARGLVPSPQTTRDARSSQRTRTETFSLNALFNGPRRLPCQKIGLRHAHASHQKKLERSLRVKREQRYRLTAPAKKHRNALPRSRSALSGSLIGYHIPTARTTRPSAHRHPSLHFGHLGTCLFCPFFGHFKHVPNCPKSQDISLFFDSTLFLSLLCHRVRCFLKNPTVYLCFLPIPFAKSC